MENKIILAQLTVLLSILRNIKEDVEAGYNPRPGICGEVRKRCSMNVYSVLQPAMEAWPHYSGNPMYPVPHPTLSAQEAYDREPLWTGAYGDKRMELLDWLIEYFDGLLYPVSVVTEDQLRYDKPMLARDRLFLAFKARGLTTTEANAAVMNCDNGDVLSGEAERSPDIWSRFLWQRTPQGLHYWYAVARRIEKSA